MFAGGDGRVSHFADPQAGHRAGRGDPGGMVQTVQHRAQAYRVPAASGAVLAVWRCVPMPGTLRAGAGGGDKKTGGRVAARFARRERVTCLS